LNGLFTFNVLVILRFDLEQIGNINYFCNIIIHILASIPEKSPHSPVAESHILAEPCKFGLQSCFLHFLIELDVLNEISPGWERAGGLAFSESKMAAIVAAKIEKVSITLEIIKLEFWF
jgi:hypothetical protein